jgi:PH (Pleckstrin Homology) domain-containing protein
VRTVKFRHNAAIAVAGIVAFLGAVPLATSRWYLAPLLLVPVAVAVWGWRSGTDADGEGLRLRALLGSRRLRWDQVDRVGSAGRRRAYAVLTDGNAVLLPAVSAADLPRLVAVTAPDTAPALDADEPA